MEQMDEPFRFDDVDKISLMNWFYRCRNENWDKDALSYAYDILVHCSHAPVTKRIR
jgi:hypothetical protein